jgi:hypothetical protein
MLLLHFIGKKLLSFCSFIDLVFLFHRRDANNPTFRKIALKDVDFSHKQNRNKMKLEDGAFFIDVTSQLNM